MSRLHAVPLACALSMVVTGCFPPRDEPDAGAERPEDGFARPRGFDPPADCAAVLGVPLDALFDADVVRLALLLPESGPAGGAGRAMRRAVALALEELAAVGGLPDGRRVGALACDSRTEPARAVELIRWMLAEFSVPAIIGPGLSAATLDLDADDLLRRGPAFVSPSATHPDLARLDDDDRFWRTAPDDGRPALALGRWLADRGRVAVVTRDDRFADAMAAALTDGLCGGPCPGDRAPRWRLGPGGDAAGTADAIADAGVDAVALLGGVDEASALLEALAERAPAVAVGLGEPMRDPDFIGGLPPAIWGRIVGVRHAEADGPLAGGFAERYRARWGEAPGPFAAHAYDAAWLILHAVGALPPGTAEDGAAVVARLRRMSQGVSVPSGPDGWRAGQAAFRDPGQGTFDFEGVSGPLDFDLTGQALSAVDGWVVSPEGRIVAAGRRLAAGEP